MPKPFTVVERVEYDKRALMPIGRYAIDGLTSLKEAVRLTVSFDRLASISGDGQCEAHYTRIAVRTADGGWHSGDNDGRSYLDARSPGPAGAWQRITWTLELPRGGRNGALRLGLANALVGPKPGYVNPVWIDNLVIAWH